MLEHPQGVANLDERLTRHAKERCAERSRDRMTCSNCGTTQDVAPRSYDLDLPTVTLCAMCSVLLVVDPDTFDRLGRESAMHGGDGGSGGN